jgi:hypothetical protein
LNKKRDTADYRKRFYGQTALKTIQNEMISYKRMLKKDSGFGLILKIQFHRIELIFFPHTPMTIHL